jgi:1,4-dihydroxy-2-naphthoyl-CoA hydrolase
MHDTDAAGIIFFGHQFTLIHDAYEYFLESIDFSFAKLLKETNFFIPIVHAEADYKAPLFVGDCLTVKGRLEKIGESSFVIGYEILDTHSTIVGTARTVHVTTNKKTRKKIPLPADFKKALTKVK